MRGPVLPHATTARCLPPAPRRPLGQRDIAPPAGPTEAGLSSGAVSACLSPTILRAARQPGTGLAPWRRSARRGPNRAIQAALAWPPFCTTAEGPPDQAARALLRDLPGELHKLGEDMA